MKTAKKKTLKLSVLDERLAICRLLPNREVPDWASQGDFFSVTRTAEELSVVCAARWVPTGVRAEVGWRALKVAGPLGLSLTGVLLSLAQPLAEAGISIFAVSTFDTDYVLVQDSDLEAALETLEKADHQIHSDS